VARAAARRDFAPFTATAPKAVARRLGLVMVEALACGMPLVALRTGSAPEVIEHVLTGFVCEDEDEMVDAVGRLGEIDRARCRAEAERRFSPAATADQYERVHAGLVGAPARTAAPHRRVPLVRPGLAVLGILTFTASWNDFVWPLIVATRPSMFVLNVGLGSLVGPYNYEYGMLLAGSFLATLPIVAVFLLFSRQLIEGLTAGAFKGA
jgi:hypothetical protein